METSSWHTGLASLLRNKKLTILLSPKKPGFTRLFTFLNTLVIVSIKLISYRYHLLASKCEVVEAYLYVKRRQTES